jgi:peptidoglycan/xylan/chitin deacetylase (PgdA/CDA1 family)
MLIKRGENEMGTPRKTGPFPYIPITKRPKIQWPGGARLALWIIPNFEVFALDEAVQGGSGKIPDVPQYAARDYGARVGVYRLMEVMQRHGIRGTVALNSEVCDVYPEIIEEAVKLNWEFMGHNESNTRRLTGLAKEEEEGVVSRTLNRIEQATGKRPAGWLGAGLQETWNTVDILAEAGLRYVADWVNDDQPYLMNTEVGQLVSLNYSVELNDKPAFEKTHMTAEQFDTMIRRQFDVLYREGKDSGRVMAIALHPYLIGVPHRIDALDAALHYICSHEGVWLATGSEIVNHYLESGATF